MNVEQMQKEEVVRQVRLQFELKEDAEILVLGEDGLFLCQVEEVSRGGLRTYRTFSYERGMVYETGYVAAA